MSKVRAARRLAGAALVVALTSGCIQTPSALTCDPTLVATGNAFVLAMSDLSTVSGKMRASMAVACAAIATDLGVSAVPSVGDGTMVSDDTMQQVCTMATTAIKAAWMSPPLVEGGMCEVDAQAQFSCESQCDVTHQCTPPTVVARCTPAELSGTCSGTCDAMATCEGSATVMANCQGTCAASCTGTCTGGTCVGMCDGAASMGTCTGMCQGECSGSCKGTCSGDCTLDSNASINCGAEATCKGGCSVAYTEPVCEGVLTPPMCTIDANCEAACESQASLEATCTPPSIVFVSTGNSAMLNATLTTNLPAILEVVAQGALVAKAAANVSMAAQSVGMQLSDSAACTVMFGVDFATQVTASVAASTTISVSVMASATVSAAAVGG
jgi:hypothetical protein